jgi:uncharacterized protein YbjT (DUF2867 family)
MNLYTICSILAPMKKADVTTTTTKSKSQIPNKVETILVTGATSMVGREVVKQLSGVTRNVSIKAAGRSIENVKGVVNIERVEPVQLDYYKPETLREALKGVDSIFAVTPFQSDMVALTQNLLEVVRKTGSIRHIVKLSVLRGDDDADHGIIADRLHRKAEKMIEDSGIPYTFICPTFFMQSFATFFPQKIKEQGTFYLPAGDGKVSFVDARDIASVAVEALINNNINGRFYGKVYNITGPEAISFRDAARILSEQVGKKITYVSISEDDARKRMKDIGWDEWRINFMVELYNIMRLGYLSDISSTIEDITGRKPKSFRQFAKDYAEDFR